ncbi:MAG: rod shape-determining protein MreD [Peptococcia bacterium]
MMALALVVLAIISLLLQSTILPYLTVGGVTPDLILVLAVLYSIFQGPKRGALMGFILGLMEDLFLGRFIGMKALTVGLTSLIVGWFAQRAFRENIIVPILAMVTATLFSELIYLCVGKIVGLSWGWDLFLWKAIPLAVYNTCLVPFIYIPTFSWFIRESESI